MGKKNLKLNLGEVKNGMKTKKKKNEKLNK